MKRSPIKRKGRPCPVPGCRRTMGATHILCATHWYQVPKVERDRIWKLYRESPGSVAHRRAVLNAIAAVCRAARTDDADRNATNSED